MILVKVLIVLLLILIIVQIPKLFIRLLVYLRLRAREDIEVEGFTDSNEKTYTDPGLNRDPLYLATLNAANISYLKEQVDKLSELKQQVNVLKSQVEANTTGINGIGEQMTLTTQELTGRDQNSKEPIPMATGLY
jgi:hypothetical protein